MNQQALDSLIAMLIPKTAHYFVPLIWGKPIHPLIDLIYPGETTQLRPGTGKTGVRMKPEYVVIHDTGMTNPEDNAKGLSRYIHAQAASPTGRVASWHFSIDQSECYNHVPTIERAWHAGDGSHAFGTTYYNESYKQECIGGGNLTGIGIESCINPGNDYALTVLRMARLTAQLLNEYQLGLDRIKQHNDFSGKNCPNVIRATTGLWESFLEATKVEKALVDMGGITNVEWKISPEGIIFRNGVVKEVVEDTPVHLELTLTMNEKHLSYHYDTLVLGMNGERRIEGTIKNLYASLPQVITKNCFLPLFDPKTKVQMSWNSSHPDLFSQEGLYTHPKQKTIIALTVQLEYNETTKQQIFELEVQ
ncbi:MAG: N-acetylmuramoyl-L-alanine amidase [Bacilli bacterium]|nr:N-acetylmuramoyl-L-alanine amidase [Bacilli bacterium]